MGEPSGHDDSRVSSRAVSRSALSRRERMVRMASPVSVNREDSGLAFTAWRTPSTISATCSGVGAVVSVGLVTAFPPEMVETCLCRLVPRRRLAQLHASTRSQHHPPYFPATGGSQPSKLPRGMHVVARHPAPSVLCLGRLRSPRLRGSCRARDGVCSTPESARPLSSDSPILAYRSQ